MQSLLFSLEKSWNIIMKKYDKTLTLLYVYHIITPLLLFFSYTLSLRISFCCQSEGSSLSKCTEVWPTKDKAPEDRMRLEEYEEHEKGHESALKVTDIVKGRARYGAHWQTRNWMDFTLLYTSISWNDWQRQNLEPQKNWQHLGKTCDTISHVGPHRGKTGR